MAGVVVVQCRMNWHADGYPYASYYLMNGKPLALLDRWPVCVEVQWQDLELDATLMAAQAHLIPSFSSPIRVECLLMGCPMKIPPETVMWSPAMLREDKVPTKRCFGKTSSAKLCIEDVLSRFQSG